MGAAEVERFLTHLAVEGRVAASTQNQALSALLFLYREVLKIDLPWLGEMARAKRPEGLPVVLTVEEVKRVLARIDGQHGLMAGLLYGVGLRLLECVRLRVKDVDFEMRQITAHDGKREKDRMTMLPQSVLELLRAHLEKVKVLHEHDVEEGFGESGGGALGRSAQRQGVQAPHRRAVLAAGDEEGGAGGGANEAGFLPHAAP